MQIEKKGPFDVIFLDPPYNRGLEDQVLRYLSTSRLANDGTLIVVEASNDTDMSFAEDLGYVMTNEKRYKTNRHCFYKRGV